MADREKVIKGLQIHADGCGYRSHHCDAMECPYRYGDESCDIEEMCRDAFELLKELEKDRLEIAHEMVSNSILMYQGKELVRCKECKHFDKSFSYCATRGYCDISSIRHDDDWFCADGERKKLEGEA